MITKNSYCVRFYENNAPSGRANRSDGPSIIYALGMQEWVNVNGTGRAIFSRGMIEPISQLNRSRQ